MARIAHRIAYRIAATLALAATGQMAQAATAKPCMTPTELKGMVAYMLPTGSGSLVDQCRPALAPGASLLTRGPQLVGEFQAGQSAAFPMARQAFAKFSDKGDSSTAKMMLGLPEVSLKPIIEMAVSEQLTSSIKVKDCPDIDRVFRTLEPLPARNFIDFFTEVITIGVRDNKDMTICPN